MPRQIENAFKFLGVTPWQFLFGAMCIGSWWATVQPLPGQLAELNRTVQQISTKVEVHGVLLTTVSKMEADVGQMRRELSTIEGRLATHPGYNPKP